MTLEETLQGYLVDHGISHPCDADVVVALLRIGTPQALARAEKLLGRPITRCPTGIPPWPPKPATRAPAKPRVARVAPNPCLPTTGAFQRFQLIHQGMTEDQLRRRGLSRRDVRLWTKAKHIEWRA